MLEVLEDVDGAAEKDFVPDREWTAVADVSQSDSREVIKRSTAQLQRVAFEHRTNDGFEYTPPLHPFSCPDLCLLFVVRDLEAPNESDRSWGRGL